MAHAPCGCGWNKRDTGKQHSLSLNTSPLQDADLIFVLEPYYDSDEDHWQTLDEWVEAGGTLIVAGEGWGVDEIFRHYEFNTYGWGSDGDVTVQSPLLASPPIDDLSHLNLSSVFSTDRDDWIVLLAVDSAPVLITFRQGQGRVILASFILPTDQCRAEGIWQPGAGFKPAGFGWTERQHLV